MNRRGWSMAMAGVLVAGATVATALEAGSADARTATVYSRTVTGTDFRPLDYRVVTQFVAGVGGGVYAIVPGDPPYPETTYLEATVDLPIGANVTAVSFFYYDCGVGDIFPGAKEYFGAYKPSSSQYSEKLAEGNGMWGNCSTEYTYTRSQATIATVQADWRYVLGVHVTLPPTHLLTTPPWVLSGARVKFTCPTACT